MCKGEHENIKIVRSHRILPFGTLLQFNIGRNVTLNDHDPVDKASVLEFETHFMDITLSDVEAEEDPFPSSSCKRKRDEENNHLSLCMKHLWQK